ncbi:MAG: hypothetical protein IJU41_00880 [Clostridia bacterium]|nr:hypothetical protein [Clostridia bacterium]
MQLVLTDAHGNLLFCGGKHPRKSVSAELLMHAASGDGLCKVGKTTYCIRPILLSGKHYKICFPAKELYGDCATILQRPENNPFELYGGRRVRLSFGALLELISRAAHDTEIPVAVQVQGDLPFSEFDAPPILFALCLILWVRLCRQPLQFAAERGRLSLYAMQVPRTGETEMLEVLLTAASAAAGFSFSVTEGDGRNYFLAFRPVDPGLLGFKAEMLDRQRVEIARILRYFWE